MTSITEQPATQLHPSISGARDAASDFAGLLNGALALVQSAGPSARPNAQ
jgi:hypothetical protein